MTKTGATVYDELTSLGFHRFAKLEGRNLQIENDLLPEPAVYSAVLNGRVFWVGETGNAKDRFRQYRRWFALPGDSPRKVRRARDQLLEKTERKPLIFY